MNEKWGGGKGGLHDANAHDIQLGQKISLVYEVSIQSVQWPLKKTIMKIGRVWSVQLSIYACDTWCYLTGVPGEDFVYRVEEGLYQDKTPGLSRAGGDRGGKKSREIST